MKAQRSLWFICGGFHYKVARKKDKIKRRWIRKKRFLKLIAPSDVVFYKDDYLTRRFVKRYLYKWKLLPINQLNEIKNTTYFNNLITSNENKNR